MQAWRSRASSDESLQLSRAITATYPTTATAAITAQKAPPLRFPASRYPFRLGREEGSSSSSGAGRRWRKDGPDGTRTCAVRSSSGSEDGSIEKSRSIDHKTSMASSCQQGFFPNPDREKKYLTIHKSQLTLGSSLLELPQVSF